MASNKGEGAIVIGNVVGSNIANILLVLSVIVIMKPIAINFDSVKQGAIYLFVSTAAIALLIYYQALTFIPGLILLLLFCIYMVNQFFSKNSIDHGIDTDDSLNPIHIGLICIGILLLGYGSHLFINSSISIAEFFNVPKIVISVSLVAFGTSVPELVTSVVALKRGEPNFIIGNVMGSNIINIFLVLGSSLLVDTIEISLEAICYPLFFMILAALLIIFITSFQKMMNRVHGLIFLAMYVLFIYLTV
jgi:cation:H+ antiporter